MEKTMGPYPSSTWLCMPPGAEDNEGSSFQFVLVLSALSDMPSVVWVSTVSSFSVTKRTSCSFSQSPYSPPSKHLLCPHVPYHKTEHPWWSILCQRSTSELWAQAAIHRASTSLFWAVWHHQFHLVLPVQKMLFSTLWSLHISFPSLLFQTFNT